MLGPILDPFWVLFWTHKSRAMLRQFLTPLWDHFWSHFGTHLDTFWRHFGELCVASTASADIAKTIKNQWFSMILPCPRCPKTAKNHLVAKRHRDSQHSSQMTSKSVPFWSQNGSKIGPKMVSERVLKLLLFLGCFLGPNWTQKWSQKGSKIGPKMGSAAQMCSWSPKWAPKWTQTGSGVSKWTQNGSQMLQNHGT